MNLVKLPQDAFQKMQFNSGVVLNKFDLTGKTEPVDADIVCATTGDISITCKPTLSDMGEDVNNCPANTSDFAHIDGWECSIGFTSLDGSPESLALSLGAATVNGSKVTPDGVGFVKADRFKDLYWAGERGDGGYCVAHLKNAMSTEGLSMTTTKNGKGQLSVTMTGFVTAANPRECPMEFYSEAGVQEGA